MNNKKFFFAIHIYRALAAALIAYGHIVQETFYMAAAHDMHFAYTRYPTAIGVDIFFVISGFVIVYASQNLYGQSRGWLKFIKRRITRIVPLYWLYTALMVCLTLAGFADNAQLSLPHVIQSFLFLPHENPGGHVRPVLALGWSLNYEMYFYALFAALLALHKSLRPIMQYLVLLLVGSVLISTIVSNTWTIFSFWFHPYVLEFLAGSIVAYAYIKGLRIHHYTAILLIMCAVIIAVALFQLPLIEDKTLYRSTRTLAGGTIGVFLISAGTLTNFTIGPAKNLITNVLGRLGDSSYTLYLAHPFIIGAAKLIWDGFGLTPGWGFVCLTLPVCLIGGYGLYLMIERPLLRLGRRAVQN